MKITLLMLLVGLLTIGAQGHIIDDDGNCIADCHEDDDDGKKLSGTNHAVVNLKTQEDTYVCGEVGELYSNSDRIAICIFFDQMTPAAQKVVYSPRVDAFEVLQLKGLYDHFAGDYDEDDSKGVRRSLTAMASGIRSAPAMFKQNNEVVSVVELQITMDRGNVTRLDWIHGCGIGCGKYDCHRAYVVDEEGYGIVSEKNCYVSGCEVPGEPTCDTQVFVTWKGTDKKGEYCESVNYAIHGFGRYGASKYMAEARNLPKETYKSLPPLPGQE